MKVLLHICCAPCCIAPFDDLVAQGHEVTGFFFNPNIHPLIEFRRRMKGLHVLQERVPIAVIYGDGYGLRRFLESVHWTGESAERCEGCYRLRLTRAAREAARGGFDAITTTLLGSTRQDHELIAEVGRECARLEGVTFHYADWRPLAEEGHRRARKMGLYMQQYCGCVFSEWERFRDTNLHVYRGAGPAAGDPGR